MKLSSLFISIVILTSIAGGIFTFFGSLAINYNVEGYENLSQLSQFNNSLDKYATNLTTNMKHGGNILDTVFFSVGLVWGSVITLISTPSLIIYIISIMLSFDAPFIIPNFFISLIVLGVTFFVIFKLFGVITNKDV